jgi:predicted phosphodiesterase
MKIQISGDLHLEYINFEKVKISELLHCSDANILILAGDIGSLYEPQKLRLFLEKICVRYRYVLYVPGNTEFYTCPRQVPKEFNYLLNELLKIEKKISNLFILNRKSVQIDDILFSGAILWSLPEDRLPSHFRIHEMSREMYTNKHMQDSKYILDSICYAGELGVKHHVIITHYCPLPGEKNNRGDMYYNKNLFEKIPEVNNCNTKFTWIFGHTHESFDQQLKGINFISNSRGKLKSLNNKYNNQYTIQV